MLAVVEDTCPKGTGLKLLIFHQIEKIILSIDPSCFELWVSSEKWLWIPAPAPSDLPSSATPFNMGKITMGSSSHWMISAEKSLYHSALSTHTLGLIPTLNTAPQTTALTWELPASRSVINSTSSTLNGSQSEEASEITLASSKQAGLILLDLEMAVELAEGTNR